ncbi:murein L,D-transpeptidase [Sphingomonas crusticola]|uniref:murein L,D-transpeptidase n=1 Tax=Sphingomonas crusticola TaxID=1697973 RepID=UPI000E24550A|nr:murein L,D-transpeptidase [Sphingomonas crusticola]
MSVVVSLSLATICFVGQCYPALVGSTTPPGHYQLSQRYVVSPGYGGDVLTFKEDPDDLFAIHRVWLGSPRERRLQRLESNQVALRQGVTGGCINIAPETYAKLVECCSTAELVVEG